MDKMPPVEETWITRKAWEALLEESRALQAKAEYLRRVGCDDRRVWEKIRPVNRTIRSPLLKVRGIDGRLTPRP